MKIFKKVLYIDGGPNDKGEIIDYKAILKNENPPKNKNGFERWEEITLKEYKDAKKQAYKKYKMFTF